MNSKFHHDGQRAEDKSVFWRITALIDKYRILVYTGVLVLVGLGFGFKTPHMMMQDLQAQMIDSIGAVRRDQGLIKTEIANSTSDRLEQRLMLEALVRVQCSNMSVHEQQRLGLPCDAVSDITHSSRETH